MSIHLWKVNQRGETLKTRDELRSEEEEERIEVEERGWKVELNFQVVFSPALKEDIGRRGELRTSWKQARNSPFSYTESEILFFFFSIPNNQIGASQISSEKSWRIHVL